MNKDYYRRMTDEAWHKVSHRIESDEMLLYPSYSRRIWIKVGVGIAVAAVALLFIFMPNVLRNEDKIPYQTQYNNDRSARLAKTLEDGSVVLLGGNSSLQYPIHFEKDRRSVRLNGEAYFDVKHQSSRPFVIVTNSAIVEVLGTAFNVKSSAKIPFELVVTRGMVRVNNLRDNSEVLVHAGCKVNIGDSGLILSKMIISDRKFDSNIRFKDETLGNILKVMNMRQGEEKLQVTPQLANRRLTVSFSNETPAMIAMLISEVLNVKYAVKNNIIYIR